MKKPLQNQVWKNIAREQIAIHLVREMAKAQLAAEAINLSSLTERLALRREDVLSILVALDAEGFVNFRHMRLTLAGFAIGASLRDAKLAPVARAPARAKYLLRAAA